MLEPFLFMMTIFGVSNSERARAVVTNITEASASPGNRSRIPGYSDLPQPRVPGFLRMVHAAVPDGKDVPAGVTAYDSGYEPDYRIHWMLYLWIVDFFDCDFSGPAIYNRR